MSRNEKAHIWASAGVGFFVMQAYGMNWIPALFFGGVISAGAAAGFLLVLKSLVPDCIDKLSWTLRGNRIPLAGSLFVGFSACGLLSLFKADERLESLVPLCAIGGYLAFLLSFELPSKDYNVQRKSLLTEPQVDQEQRGEVGT